MAIQAPIINNEMTAEPAKPLFTHNLTGDCDPICIVICGKRKPVIVKAVAYAQRRSQTTTYILQSWMASGLEYPHCANIPFCWRPDSVQLPAICRKPEMPDNEQYHQRQLKILHNQNQTVNE
jgi:hypothetical protein